MRVCGIIAHCTEVEGNTARRKAARPSTSVKKIFSLTRSKGEGEH